MSKVVDIDSSVFANDNCQKTMESENLSKTSLEEFEDSLSNWTELDCECTVNENDTDCDRHSDDQTKISPMRGRSVKEYDEQLTALKKENFNLKLRIYFLEERMGHTFRIEDKDNFLRKNIEYQVEIESLRKEVEDKQELLCQAVKAMELQDEEHKKVIKKKEVEHRQLLEEKESLHKELQDYTEAHEILVQKQDKLMEDSSAMYTQAFNLHDENNKTKEEIEQLQLEIEDLHSQLNEEREQNAMLENNLHEAECLHRRCESLEAELEQRDNKLKSLVTELEETGHTLSSCNLRLRTLDDELSVKNGEIESKKQELIKREKTIQEQQNEIEELKKLLDNGNILCDKEQRQTENLKTAVAERNKSIAELETKLEKCKTIIRNLEVDLNNYKLENKRCHDELLALKTQRRARNDNDGRYFASWSPRKSSASPRCTGETLDFKGDHEVSSHKEVHALRDELTCKEARLKKLDEEQRKACNLIQTFMMRIKCLEKEITDLKGNLQKKDVQVGELQKKLVRRAATLQNPVTIGSSQGNHSVENEKSLEPSDEEITFEELKKCNSFTMEGEKQIQNLQDKLQERENQLQIFECQYESTISIIKNKDNRITELEKEVELLTDQVRLEIKKQEELKVTTDEPVALAKINEEKDKQIERLEHEVRKHTSNLQVIVNTELWEKNNEIEKLQNRLTDKLKVKDQEIAQLEKNVLSRDMQLKMLKDKIEELGVHVNLPSVLLSTKLDDHENKVENNAEFSALQEQLKMYTAKSKYLQITVDDLQQQLRNKPERDSDSLILQLKADCLKWQQEYEKCEKSRVDMGNVCVLLTTRLEELAHFLEVLLKHHSVLGLLNIKQKSAIKNAIDQSLDLSKTFSLMSEDKSLVQLSSLSGFLNTTQNSCDMSMFESYMDEGTEKRSISVPEMNTSLTYNSHLFKNKIDVHEVKDVFTERDQIIKVLRGQIETMKKEIELRDMELANIAHENIAEEKSLKDDNDLVEAIIDMENKSVVDKKSTDVMSPSKIYQNLIDEKSYASLKNEIIIDNQSESEAWSEPDRDVSRNRIGLNSGALKSVSINNLIRTRTNKSVSGDEISTESTEDEVVRKLSKSPPKRNSSSSTESRHTIRALEDQISILQNKLKEKDNEMLSMECKMMEVDNKLKQDQLQIRSNLEKINNEKREVENMLKESEEMIETLEKEREVLESKLNKMKQDRDEVQKIVEQKEIIVKDLIEKSQALEKTVSQNEIIIEQKIRENDIQWTDKIKNMEKELEDKLQSTIKELKTHYETEWIQKTEMNKYHAKMELVYSEVESLKEMLKTVEVKAKRLEDAETELKNKLEESENDSREKILSLKRELNEYALRTSQAVLERTKINNEKLKIEQELRKVESRENEISVEYKDKHIKLMNIKNNIEKQLAQIELQKSNLQLKISELESTNAELQNRLLRSQSNNMNSWPKSTPTSPNKFSEVTVTTRNYGKHSLASRTCFTRQRSDMSGYASEDVLTDDNDGGVFNRSAPAGFHWFSNACMTELTDARNIANSSPDLGIESDPGRFSSLETNVTPRPLLQTLELTASMNHLLSDSHLDNVRQFCNVPAHKNLERENDDLQKTVSRLENGLEKTMNQLSLINKNKKQVEKAVCKQIHKTSIVLRKARANLDSGSENEVRK